MILKPAYVKDWDLLRRVAEDLAKMFAELRIVVPAGITSQDWAELVQEAIRRWSAERRPPMPAMIELEELLFVDGWPDEPYRSNRYRWLCGFIWLQMKKRAWYERARKKKAVLEVHKDMVVRTVTLVITNAHNWWTKGDHTEDWQGWMILTIPTLLDRLANRLEIPDAPDGLGNVPDDEGGNPADRAPDKREASPEFLADLDDEGDFDYFEE
jgi:hypothetical protein